MKMIIAIIDDEKQQEVSQALINAEFRVTQLATTSGLLRGGETSLMIGVADDQVEHALQIIRDKTPPLPDNDTNQATIYVLNVRSHNRL
jgi:uncharacterized protein YaaQ